MVGRSEDRTDNRRNTDETEHAPDEYTPSMVVTGRQVKGAAKGRGQNSRLRFCDQPNTLQ